MATTMLCPSWSVLRLQSNIITNEQTTQLAKRPIWPRPPERLGALVSAFLSAAPLLTRSNIHRRDSLPAVSCNAGFCNAPEARCLTSTMLMALQKPHRSANGVCLSLSRPATESYPLAPKSSQGVGTNPMAKLDLPRMRSPPPGCRPCGVTWRRLEQGQRDTPPW